MVYLSIKKDSKYNKNHKIGSFTESTVKKKGFNSSNMMKNILAIMQ